MRKEDEKAAAGDDASVSPGRQGERAELAPRTIARGKFVFEREIPAEEEAQIKKLREDRVGQCGWASDNRRPYRPLGTPDLERRDPYRKTGTRARKGRADNSFDFPLPFLDAKSKDIPKARQMRRWRHTGIEELNGAVKHSEARLRLCANGKSFVNSLRNQQQLIIPCSQLRGVSSLWSLDIQQSIASLEDVSKDAARSALLPPAIQSLATPSSPPLQESAPASEHRIVEKAMTQLGMKRRDASLFLPAVASRGKQETATTATKIDREEATAQARQVLAALPETGVGSLRSSFMDMQARMRERLAESLSEQASARLENYERRHFALPPHSVGQLSIAAWELEAERSRLQRMLSQLDEHQWWSRLMYQLTSNNAQLTSEQQVVLFILKETIERGEPFGQEDFFALVLLLPREYHNYEDVQRILQFLREELDISVPIYRGFLEKKGLPVPNSLKRDQGPALHRTWARPAGMSQFNAIGTNG